MRVNSSFFGWRALAGVMILSGRVMATSASAEPIADPAVTNFGCQPRSLPDIEMGVGSDGPLRLAQISCVAFRSSSFGTSEALVSPDGKSVVRWHAGSPAPIEAVSLEASRLLEFPNRIAFRGFASSEDDRVALSWAADSQSLWTVRQDVVTPNGWALSGLKPVRISLDGRVLSLKPLTHEAGPLDGLQWVGGNGVALAKFGMRGGYYRPEHDDKIPTFAIVDASRGQVRAAFPATAIPELRERALAGVLRNGAATAVMLPNGRVRAVISFGPWMKRIKRAGATAETSKRHPAFRVLWTESEAPRQMAMSEDTDGEGAVTLTPDGSGLLVVRSLQPNGIQIFDCRECKVPPPKPVTAPIAELVDVQTGKALWRLSARATEFWAQSSYPAVSPNGQYALFQLPPENGRSIIAFVRMRDGRVLQRFSAVGVGSDVLPVFRPLIN